MSSVTAEVPETASSNPDGYSVQVQSQDDDSKAYREHFLPTLQRRDLPGSAVKLIPGRIGGGVSGSSPVGDEISGTFTPSFHDDEFSSTTAGKGDEQESDDNSSIYNSPASYQIEQFIEKVASTINADMSKFPEAHGLVITFSNKTCPSAEDELPNIQNSNKHICSAFSQFGYVCSVFYECCRAKFLAVFKALTTKIQIPDSYKMVFIYFIGHGQKGFVGVQDGYVSVSKLKGLLGADNSAINRIPKILFLDCCRRELTDRSERLVSSVENLLIVNTTRLYRRAYLDNSEGMGVATIEFVNLLDKHQESWSFHDLIAEFISAVKETYKKISAQQPHLHLPDDNYTSLWPDYEGSLDRYPNLYKDKLMAMMPTELVLDQQSLKLTVKHPVHARHHGFHHFFVKTKSRHSQGWVKDFPNFTSTELQLSMEQVAGKKFRVGAAYENGMEVVGQDTVYYEFGDLKPTGVQVKKISKDQAEISWVESDNLFLYDQNSGHQFISVGKKKLHANIDYTEFKKIEDVGQCSHVIRIRSQEAEENEFAVQYHVNDRSSGWIEAERIYCDKPKYDFLQDLEVSQGNEDKFTVQWKESPHFEEIVDKETYIAIKAREKNGTQWVDIQTNIQVCDRACTISAAMIENPEFMVELFEKRNDIPYLIELHIVSYNQQELESCENNRNEQHPSRTKTMPRCCNILIKLCTFFTFVLVTLVFVNYTYGFSQFYRTYLGVASDVIDCEDTNSLKRYIYGSLSVTQRALVSQVDNPHLEINVFSIPYSNITYHSFLWSGKSTIEIKHGSESGPSVVPDDYYNRPWYLRSQSNISLQVNLKFNEPPFKMALYLFDNEDDLNSFVRDPDSTPRYVRIIDLLASKQDPYFFLINKSSYYYVVADIRTNSKIIFSAEVTFNVVYIDNDDYPSAYKRHIGSNGGTVKVPVDAFGHNLTVCSISPLPDDSVDPHTTHIEITYHARALAAIIIAIILAFILILIILISVLFHYIAKWYFCKLQNDRNDVASVPLIL